MNRAWWFGGIGMALAVAQAGCGSLTVRQHFTQYGMGRASLELACPREKIELVEVDQPLDQPLWSGGTLVGVKGCAHHAVYVSTDTGTWILNSVTNGTGAADSADKSKHEKPNDSKPKDPKSASAKKK